MLGYEAEKPILAWPQFCGGKYPSTARHANDVSAMQLGLTTVWYIPYRNTATGSNILGWNGALLVLVSKVIKWDPNGIICYEHSCTSRGHDQWGSLMSAADDQRDMLTSRDYRWICRTSDCATDSPESLSSVDSAESPRTQGTPQTGAGYIRTAPQHVSSFSRCVQLVKTSCQSTWVTACNSSSTWSWLALFSAKTNLRPVLRAASQDALYGQGHRRDAGWQLGTTRVVLRPEVSRRVNQALVGFRGEESKSESQQMRVVISNSDCNCQVDHRERLDTCWRGVCYKPCLTIAKARRYNR